MFSRDSHHILLYNHLANSYTRLANCLLDSADKKAATKYYRNAIAARLRAIGFADVDCHWKWMELALLGITDRDLAAGVLQAAAGGA